MRPKDAGKVRKKAPARNAPAPRRKTLTIEGAWSLESGSQVAIIGLFLMSAIYAVSWGAFFLIPIATALIVGLTLGPPVDKLERLGLPPYLAGLVLLLATAAGLYGLFLAFAIPLEEWSSRIPEVLTRLREVVFWIRDPLTRLLELGEQVQDAATTDGGELKVAVKQQGVVTVLFASAPRILAQVLIFMGAFYFFLVGRRQIRASVLSLAPTRRARLRVGRIIRDTEYSLSTYLFAITMVNSGLGIATGLTMWALGMPSPALWGALATVLNFVPYLGPALMVCILAGVALVSFPADLSVFLPPLAFLGLNIIESQFATPTVVGMRLTLNPFYVFLSLAFWLWLWGPVGAFLAVPLLVLGMITLYHCLPPDRRAVMALRNGA